jgi:hypothetical protein
MNEYDNYYNHGIYRSGFTYQQQVMSSPLFYPVIESEGISMGLQSNRFFSHHFGVNGVFADHFNWKGMLTYIQHFGTYSKPFASAQKQISGFFEVQYSSRDFPVELGVALSADDNNTYGKNLGFRFSVAKSW